MYRDLDKDSNTEIWGESISNAKEILRNFRFAGLPVFGAKSAFWVMPIPKKPLS